MLPIFKFNYQYIFITVQNANKLFLYHDNLNNYNNFIKIKYKTFNLFLQ